MIFRQSGRYILLFLFTAGIAISLCAQSTFRYTLPDYSYYKLDNGFELILLENHTNPLVASVVVVKTGLRNETPENNGVSHVLEHMTFNGTTARTQEQLYNELDFYGIYLNAQTSEDYTSYMALVHKDQIERSVDIQSDMLFHSIFPEKKFDKEKGIIVEEIRRDSEAPDFKSDLALRRDFYKNPPYSMPVIGTTESVRNMTRNQVMEYYEENYRPNNMIAIVIGDFQKEQMLALFKEKFGKAKSGHIPEIHYSLDQSFPFHHSSTNESDQITTIVLPAPVIDSRDYIPFRFYLDYYLDEQTGKLVNSLRENKDLNISRVQTSYEFHPEFGLLYIKVTTAPGIEPARIKKAIVREFTNLLTSEPDKKALQAMKNQQAISDVLEQEKILYYGFLKSQALAVGGFPVIEKLTPALLDLSLSRFNNFIARYPRTWNQPEKLFAVDHWTNEIDISPFQHRKKNSAREETRLFRHQFPNGMTAILLHNTDNPVLALHFLFRNRSAWEPADKLGIADFLHHSLFQASKKYPREKLTLALKEIGAEVKAYDWAFIPYDDYYNVPQYSYIRFVTLDSFFDRAMDIVADNILHPDLTKTFSDAKMQMARLAAQNNDSPDRTARLHFRQLLFGADHPLARPVSGYPQTISNISETDVREFHSRYFTAGNVILSIVSSLDSATIFSAVERYFGEMPQTADSITIPPIPVTGTSIQDSTEMGSRQAYIYWGYDFDIKTGEFLPLSLMNNILSDQIAFDIRETRGLAYRVGSSLNRWRNGAYLNVSLGTGKENIVTVKKAISTDIADFAGRTLDMHSLQKAQNSQLASMVRRRASRENQAYVLGLDEFRNEPLQYFNTVFDAIKKITPEQVNAVKNEYLQTDHHVLFFTIPNGTQEQKTGMPGMKGMH